MNRLCRFGVTLVAASLSVILSATSAVAQSQTPGQVTQFDPNLNVVDSVITQDPSGNIGIGTTVPAARLDVVGGNLNLENSSLTAGNVLKGGAPFLHNFGFQNTFLGSNAGNLAMFGTGLNTGVGYEALENNRFGSQNTATGAEALENNVEGQSNTALGAFALTANIRGGSNTAIGVGALGNNTTAFSNTAVGNLALQSNNGFENTATGVWALTLNTTGDANTADGLGALQGNTTGRLNTASGFSALIINRTGSNNTAIGARADVTADGLTNATAIGSDALVDSSNKIRLGSTQVIVIEGQVPYTFTSDRKQKENFRPVNGEEVLRKLGGLNLTSWNYIGHDPHQFRHYGPVAQEFFAAFGDDGVGTIGTPTTINSGDLEGILMIAVQTLEKQNAELKARIEALERLVKTVSDQRER